MLVVQKWSGPHCGFSGTPAVNREVDESTSRAAPLNWNLGLSERAQDKDLLVLEAGKWGCGGGGERWQKKLCREYHFWAGSQCLGLASRLFIALAQFAFLASLSAASSTQSFTPMFQTTSNPTLMDKGKTFTPQSKEWKGVCKCLFHKPCSVGRTCLYFFIVLFLVCSCEHTLSFYRNDVNTCTPVVDACWCMAKPIQYCKVKIIIMKF